MNSPGKRRRELAFLPALIISLAAIILYQVFKTPELEREIKNQEP